MCRGCLWQRKPCDTYPVPRPKNYGCPDDPSWAAFARDAGWEPVFLGDILKDGALGGVNPNYYGMIESIACSRASVFAGTYWSTFTGYIHRLRGYHGLGEVRRRARARALSSPPLSPALARAAPRDARARARAGELLPHPRQTRRAPEAQAQRPGVGARVARGLERRRGGRDHLEAQGGAVGRFYTRS